MNVTLRTKTQDPSLEFVDLRRSGHDSGYCSGLTVVSHGFRASLTFCFEPPSMDEFLEQLTLMDATLRGRAVLKPLYEDPYIVLEMERLGHVRVSGDLVSHVPTQRLQFEFFTDQTVLRPLIEDLLVVKGGPVAA